MVYSDIDLRIKHNIITHIL